MPLASPTRLALSVILVCLGLVSAAPRAAADTVPDFAREVRPILSQYCFKCHGPDDKARKAKLRLDEPGAAVKHGAIVAGNVDSEFVQRLFSDDAEQRMPPAATKMTLTAVQKDVLKRWVAAGAKYESHWAYVKPTRPALPAVHDPKWVVRNPIDAFILARLAKEGLSQSPEADRATLLRRVYLDLIGLPPSPEEVSAFVADQSPDAYEKVVDALLKSPQYGERWARKWLDLARYADTNGYEKDRPRSIWPYRNWVIAALNADMPFDEFTIKQLAGDMLPNATPADRIATGFHRNTMLNEEGGIDPQEFRYYSVVDRLATTGTTWMGLTVGCAQCHTHKYDPISHTEYFRLFAFLNNADEPEMALPDPTITTAQNDTAARVAKLTSELGSHFPKGVDADRAFAHWLWVERARATPWRTIQPTDAKSNSPLLTIEADGTVFASGDMTKSDTYDLTFRGDFIGVAAVRVEALPDDRLPKGGPGRIFYEGPFGDFKLSEITATADGRPVKFTRASHSFAAGGNTAAAAIDGNQQSGWTITGGQGKRHVAVFSFGEPLGPTKELDLKMLFEHYYSCGLGKFRVSVTTARHSRATDIPPAIEALLLKQDATLTTADRTTLREHFYLTTTHLAAARKQIDDLRKQVPQPTTTLVMSERPGNNPRPTFLHQRGEFLRSAERVEAGVPAFLPTIPAASRDRLAFAKWLVSADNPLTARVTVNRTWAALFGRGLVKTTDDFGYQGEFPSHPELLDWLAVEFVQPSDPAAREWSMKRLHKLIVTSATYRQTSRATPATREKDPQNVLLARGPRVRLDAEVIRDSALKVAGLLTNKVGGPSVHPPQPASVTEAAYGGQAWPVSNGPDRYRRSLYTFTKRTAPFAAYTTFDAPSGEACVARRDVSNTPLQALTLLNDHMFLEAATAAGKAVAAAPGSEADKVKLIFREFLSRNPTPDEMKLLSGFLEKETRHYSEKPVDARTLTGAAAGEKPATVAARAAWVALARTLMNLDEFVTKN
ncbi:PSD1 and planctomycete cytochrome C domain-containing protein [Fimbriiglobus ruber]|uniref:Cytochrome c domain-containing protein n=1 Tax=Fimbriiglobus ruber TaxID=1908690 RepID=A0A225EBM7_9BACT|nr:PSD1 and planctomycete cytochrome C domain-containing protein [Fimbriiglobus ruber]OWK47416.1 hypothetical protein FRUB_01115 [Fimbriiglobus ruber]